MTAFKYIGMLFKELKLVSSVTRTRRTYQMTTCKPYEITKEAYNDHTEETLGNTNDTSESRYTEEKSRQFKSWFSNLQDEADHSNYDHFNLVVHKSDRDFSTIAIDQALEQNNAVIIGDGGAARLAALKRWMVADPGVSCLIANDEAVSEK